jgi:hypothetical protein
MAWLRSNYSALTRERIAPAGPGQAQHAERFDLAGLRLRCRPFVEKRQGDDLHRDTREWRTLNRAIDRDNDRYTETITSPTRGVVRDVDEPLSQHRGHGAAKRPGPD